MDSHTFAGTIRTFKHRAPFRPFSVVTVGGNQHEVDHSDALAAKDRRKNNFRAELVPDAFSALKPSKAPTTATTPCRTCS